MRPRERTVIGDDLDSVVLPDTNTAIAENQHRRARRPGQRRDSRVGGTEINTNGTVEQIVSHFFE